MPTGPNGSTGTGMMGGMAGTGSARKQRRPRGRSKLPRRKDRLPRVTESRSTMMRGVGVRRARSA